MHWLVFIKYITKAAIIYRTMSNNLLRITDTVEGESKVYQHKFSNLEQSLRDLSQGGLFQQIEAMVQEVRRLTQMNEKYEVRYFLLSVEIERRGRIIEDSVNEINELRRKLLTKDTQHSKDLERIKEESNAQLRIVLCQEIDRIKSQFEAEKQKEAKKMHELELELNCEKEENFNLGNKISQLLNQLNGMRLQVDDLKGELGNGQKQRDFELSRLRAEYQQSIRDAENRNRADMESLRNQQSQERGRELELARKQLIEGFNGELSMKDSIINNLKLANNHSTIRIKELEAEIDYLNSIIQSKDKELSEGKDLSTKLTQEYDKHVKQIMANQDAEIKQIVADKDKEAEQKLQTEAEKYEREAKDKTRKISQLEQHLRELSADFENERNLGQEAKKHIEKIQEELKKKEKQLQYEVTSVEETLTVTIEEKDNEIAELLSQIQSLHEMYKNKMQLEITRGNNLATENEQLKRDNLNLQELSTTRKKEIEEWYQKYKDYLTPEEASKLKEDNKRLRSFNMNQEDATLKQKLEVSKHVERIRTLEAELDNKEDDIKSLSDHLKNRGDKVLELQSEKEDVEAKLRKFLAAKDSEDAMRMVFKESELKHQQENAQLRTQRDNYKQQYEKSLIEVEKLNQKYSEILKKNEEHMSKLKNASQTTSHIVRTSQHITRNVSEMSH